MVNIFIFYSLYCLCLLYSHSKQFAFSAARLNANLNSMLSVCEVSFWDICVWFVLVPGSARQRRWGEVSERGDPPHPAEPRGPASGGASLPPGGQHPSGAADGAEGAAQGESQWPPGGAGGESESIQVIPINIPHFQLSCWWACNCVQCLESYCHIAALFINWLCMYSCHLLMYIFMLSLFLLYLETVHAIWCIIQKYSCDISEGHEVGNSLCILNLPAAQSMILIIYQDSNHGSRTTPNWAQFPAG